MLYFLYIILQTERQKKFEEQAAKEEAALVS